MFDSSMTLASRCQLVAHFNDKYGRAVQVEDSAGVVCYAFCHLLYRFAGQDQVPVRSIQPQSIVFKLFHTEQAALQLVCFPSGEGERRGGFLTKPCRPATLQLVIDETA